MSDPVVHLDPDLHARLKTRCKANGVSVRGFAEAALERALAAEPEPAPRKAFVRMDDAADPDVWRRPPFWAGRPKGTRR